MNKVIQWQINWNCSWNSIDFIISWWVTGPWVTDPCPTDPLSAALT